MYIDDVQIRQVPIRLAWVYGRAQIAMWNDGWLVSKCGYDSQHTLLDVLLHVVWENHLACN
jgi:hypothetical protein